VSAGAYTRCDTTVRDGVAKLASINLNNAAALDSELLAMSLHFGADNPEFELITSGWSEYIQYGLQASRDYIALSCAKLTGLGIGSASTTKTTTPAPAVAHPVTLQTSGGVSGVEASLSDYLVKSGGGSTAANPGTLSCAAPTKINQWTDLLCNWVGGNGLGNWAFVVATKKNATRAIEVEDPQIQCSTLAPGQVAAVDAFEGSRTCESPTGIYVPYSAVTVNFGGTDGPLSTNSLVSVVTSDSALPAAATSCAAGEIGGVRVDTHRQSWAAWYFYSEGASSGLCPSVGGLAHEVNGTWTVVSGPAFDLVCGAPASIPRKVLSDLGASRSCPPTPMRFGADFASSQATTTTTTMPQASVTVAEVVQAFEFALHNGTAPGAAAIPDAVVTCGPPDAPLTPGSYLGCDVNSQTVGGVGAILQMTGPGASDYNEINLGSANLCVGDSAAEAAAWNAWAEYQGLQTC
jgi:hypothetical protein